MTVIGTVLPFSTSGGMSSLTLPVCTAASPMTLRIAAASIAGVASAGRMVTIGTAPSTAAPRRGRRNWRRVDSAGSVHRHFLFAQRDEIRHHVLDLLGGQDRLAAPGGPTRCRPSTR